MSQSDLWGGDNLSRMPTLKPFRLRLFAVSSWKISKNNFRLTIMVVALCVRHVHPELSE